MNQTVRPPTATALTIRLLLQFIHRELTSRFVGSSLGLAWAFINPLAQLLTYSFVFATVMKVRSTGDGQTGFLVFLALGLWPWMALSESVSRGSQSVLANAALVKRTRFRHDLVVYATVLSTFALQMLAYGVVLIWIAATQPEPVHLAGLPRAALSLAAMLMLAIGLSLTTAAVQVFVRDLEQALAPMLAMAFYLSPILYSMNQTPDWVQQIMAFNPVAVQVTSLRESLLHGAYTPDLADLTVLAASAAIWWLGHRVFQRLSPHFDEAM